VKRGDLVTVAVSGDFGRPHPALIIQSDRFDETDTVTVLLVSGTLQDVPFDPAYGAADAAEWPSHCIPGDGRQGYVGET
jgi:mRNA-degrading endonuclease toxin of MazEF toxin-antitoxin module